MIHARGKIGNIGKWAVFFAFFGQPGHGLGPDIFESGQRIADGSLFRPEFGKGMIDRGRQYFNAHLPRLIEKHFDLVGIALIEGHDRGHELHRVIGLEIGGLIGQQGIGGGMGLVEAIGGEFLQQAENGLGCLAPDPAFGGSLDKAGALPVHFGLDLLAHGAAQQIGFAQRIAGQLAGDLHDLLLIDDHPIGFAQYGLQPGIEIFNLLAAKLAVDIGGDIVHGTGAVERDHGNNVLEAVGLQLPQIIPHAGAFELEHPDGGPAGQQLIGGGIIEAVPGKIQLSAPFPYILDGLLDDGQGLEAQKVELDQPGGLHPFHVELGDRQIGAGIAIERDQLIKRAVADHHPGGMGGGVAVKPFELLGNGQQFPHHRLGLGLFPQFGFFLQGLGKGDADSVGDQLGEAVNLAIGHLQDAAHIADHRLGLQFSESDDLGHPLMAIFLLHIADHLLAPVLTEINVEIGHGDPFGIEKALEQQAEADGIEIGYGQRPGNQRTRPRAAPGTNRNALGLGPFDEIGNDQEIAGKFHAGNDAQLEIKPLPVIIL